MVLPSPHRWDNSGHLCSEALQTAQTGMHNRGGIHHCPSYEVSQVKPRPRQTQKNSVVQSKVKLDKLTKDFHLIDLMTDHCGLLKWGGPMLPSQDPASGLQTRWPLISYFVGVNLIALLALGDPVTPLTSFLQLLVLKNIFTSS